MNRGYKTQTMYIGFDNGVSGTIGIIYGNCSKFFQTPVKKEQNYTKKKANISRIDFPKLNKLIQDHISEFNPIKVFCLVERPMVNPGRFQASASALRSLESLLLCIELNQLSYQYIDSKEWQKVLLPKGSKGPAELKKDSATIGIRLFPEHASLIKKHKDADGILIAEYAKRTY